jgi:hypothetical protein
MKAATENLKAKGSHDLGTPALHSWRKAEES